MMALYCDVNTGLQSLTNPRENQRNFREEKFYEKERKKKIALSRSHDFVLHSRVTDAQTLGNFSSIVLNHTTEESMP